MKKLLRTVLILGGLSIAPLYGYGDGGCYQDYCCDPMGTGFLVGGYGAFHTFYFHSKDGPFDISDTEVSFFEYDLIQRAPGGGGYIGYGIPFCDCFSIALKGGITGFASDAKHQFQDDTTDENNRNRLSVDYLVDLVVQVGAQITDRSMSYFSFGASYVSIDQSYKVIDDDNNMPVLSEVNKNYHNWGFVLGAGSQFALTNCFGAFVQFDWHSYPLNVSPIEGVHSTDPDQFFRSHLTRLHGAGITAGISFEF